MKKMIVRLLSVLLVGVLISGCNEKQADKMTIGVLQLAKHVALDSTLEGLQDHLKEKGLLNELNLVVKNANGSSTDALTIAQQFVQDDVDLIYAIATQAVQAAYNATSEKAIPIVFNAVTDPVEAGVVASLDNSGNHVTGVSDAAPLDLQLALIKEMLPNAKRIGLLYNLGEINGKIQVDQVELLAPEYGLETTIIGVSAVHEIDSAVMQLTSQVDAIYNITDNMIVSSTALITNKANEQNIPVFAAEDGPLDQGLLAVEGLSYYKLGLQAGALVEAILFDGVLPANLPIKTAQETSLKVNLDVAESLNITIPDSVLNRLE